MQDKQINKATLFTFCGGYTPAVIISCALSAMSAVLAVMPFVCIWKIIKGILDVFPGMPAPDSIEKYGWLAFAYAVASIVLYFISLILSHKAAFHTSREMRSAALKYIVKLPLGFFTRNPSGKLRKIINDSASQIQTFLAHSLPDLAGAFTTLVTFLAVIFVFDWRLGIVCLVPMVVALVCMGAMMGGDKIEVLNDYQNSLEDMNSQAVEYVRGIPVVKVFQQTVYSFNKFHETIQRYKKLVIDYALACRLPLTGFNVAVNGIFALLLPVGIIILNNSGDLKGFFLDFMFYVLFTPLCALLMSKIVFTSDSMILVKDALKRINSILEEPVMEECGNPEKISGYGIEFCDVKFEYKESDQPALDNVSFKIPANTISALVGPSGSGKTTVASLLSRYWDVQGGSIKIGGRDIRNISTKDLMDNISYIFQDTHMFKTTLLENVRIAKQDATREEVMKALKDARCEDILEKLPKGLDTLIGSKGVYLSGGEQQRISIARAILKDSPIIILDEATSFADPENEHKIQISLGRLIKNKTVLMIAHRLTTVQSVDNIIVLNNGHVEEEGTHGELINCGGTYAGMWKEYQQSTRWKVG